MRISLILPVYNEKEGLEKSIERIEKFFSTKNIEYELIAVDDGSDDGSSKILAKKNVKIIRHNFNKGYGASLKTGIKNAQYEYIAIIDADGTYDINDFSKLIEYADQYDMVVGTRSKSKIPSIRRPAKWFLNKLANYLAEAKIPDINSGFRVFKKKAILKFFNILPSGFSFTTTSTLAFLSNNYDVKYVPVNYYKRDGKSKIRPVRDTLNFINLIIRTVLYFNPLKVFIPLSLFLFFTGIFILLYSYFFMQQVMDLSSIVIILSSIQVAVIGLLADLIDKRIQK